MSVYFAKVGRYLKIGFSENPERRVRNLWKSGTRYDRPWDLSLHEPRELLLAVEGDKDTEQMVHLALAEFRSNGEWFIDEPAVRDFMARLASPAFLARVDAGKVARLAREGGEFDPVPWTEMPPEREAEVDAYIARRRKAAVA